MQILYEIDVARHTPAEVLANHLAEAEFEWEVETWVRTVVVGVLQNLPQIDGHIEDVAPEWPLDQMAPVDRNILRVAIYELLHQPDTPLKVAINEAVELARQYGSDSSRRFVNGALGTFAKRHLDQS